MPSSDRITLNVAELAEARGWLADCEWRDTEFMAAEDRFAFFAEFPDATIERIVDREYEGGLAAFVIASGLRGEAYECPSCHAAPGEPCKVTPGFTHVIRDRLAGPAHWAQVANVSTGWTVG